MNVRELTLNAPRASATTVSVSASSAQTGVLAAGDYVYVCNQPSYLLVGSNPTATTSCIRIPADCMVRIAGVQDNEKIATIADSNGTAWVVQL